MGTYVTETGFNKRTFEELKEYYTKLAQSIWGGSVDLDISQAPGALVDFLATTDAEVWDTLGDTYTTNDLRNAVGTSLERNIGALLGILRNDANEAQVISVAAIGEEGTVVPSGKLVGNTTNEASDRVTFVTDTAVTIEKAAAVFAEYTVDDIGPTNTITLESVPYSTAVATDKLTIVNALAVLVEAAGYDAQILGTNDEPILRVVLGDASTIALTTFDIGATTEMSISRFGSPVSVTASLEGFVSVGVGFIDRIVTGAAGWTAIYNAYSKTPGTGVGIELDPEYRNRLLESAGNSGLATERAIRTVVLNLVDAVTTAVVLSNRTLTALTAPGSNGQAPKSFQVYVDGVGTLAGSPTSEQQALAEAIFIAAGAGIEMFGTQGPILVLDDEGVEQEVFYSIVAPVDIELEVSREKYEEFNEYPANGDDLIKDALVSYTQTNWILGRDVIPSRLVPPIYASVPGVGRVLIKARIKGGGGSYSEDTIAINSTSVAALALADIAVQDF